MSEGSGSIDRLKTIPLKEPVGKVRKFFTPLRQRVAATIGAGIIGVSSIVGAVINNNNPDRLPTNEPIVQTIPDNIKINDRELNPRITDWENKVYDLINNGSVTSVSKFNINVAEGSESVKLRSLPLYDLWSGNPNPQYQAELLPGFEGSFYGIPVNEDQLSSLDSKEGNWYVVFLPPSHEGERPYPSFLDIGTLELEQDSIQVTGVRFDEFGFPIVQIDGQDQRIGVISESAKSPATP